MKTPIRPLTLTPRAAAMMAHKDSSAAEAMTPSKGRATFVHLKVHSAYSLLEGALRIEKIAQLADAAGMPAVALTDTNNLFGILEFSEKVAKGGIQPIVGVSLALDCQDRSIEEKLKRPLGLKAPHMDGLIALYATSAVGYQNLMKLVSRAHLLAADVDGPHIKMSDLRALAEDLIILTGGPDGPIDRQLADGQTARAAARLEGLRLIGGDRLYVELQRHGLPREREVEPLLIDLAYTQELPLVATNECCFAKRDDYEAHDVLVCIAEGRYVNEDDRRKMTTEHYFKSAKEMAVMFADLPEALASTIAISQRCSFILKGRKPILPNFVMGADGVAETERLGLEADELRRQAEAGLNERCKTLELAPGFTRDDYDKRLAYEIDVIIKMKFPGYFLIVADFIQWSKRQGIPVGPGRGSGAGSLVAYALTITDLDPLRFGLLFERFLNPERVSMPDFDIDFCQDRRGETIRYVQQKYGQDRVAQIITHGKLQARAVLRDVGRVLQMPYGQVSKLCAMVPNNPAKPVTLREAIDGEPRLQEAAKEEPIVARLLAIAEKLEGLYRHASTHAAGMVIGDRPLDELVPMYRDPKSDMPVTQFNWKLVEAAGLVKFDFLGLKTLTVLEKAVMLIKRGHGVTIDLPRLAIAGDDPKVMATYALLAKGDTVGVFQLESTGMRESLKRLKPDQFEDIIAMVSLYRPGPMDSIPTYINRKHGEEPPDYLHPMLEGILKETHGVIIYQEQVMQIAQVLAGYSLGDADILRRAMGKKDKKEMAQQQQRFVDGAKKNKVKEKDAVTIFELVDKFAGYGFNKSHAAAYALVSYHTAYLKANYREEFLAASMTLDMGNTDKLAMFASEARRSGIEVAPPSINHSGVDFHVERATPNAPNGAMPKGAIRYSLAALKGIGPSAVETIVIERTANGQFKSLSDFASRLNPKALNKRGLEMLSAAGAFDLFEPNRSAVFANADTMLGLANRVADNAATGTEDLFAGGGPGAAEAHRLDLKQAGKWTPMERLTEEFRAVGFYLTGHPLDSYESVLPKLGVVPYAEFELKAGLSVSQARIAAIVVSHRERRSQKGNKFAFALFSDTTAQFEAVLFSETLTNARDLLEPGTPVLLTLTADRDGDTVKLRTESVESLDKAAQAVNRGLKLVLDRRAMQHQAITLDDLKASLQPADARSGNRGGDIRMTLELEDWTDAADGAGRVVEFVMPGKFDVSPRQKGVLSALPGVLEVHEL